MVCLLSPESLSSPTPRFYGLGRADFTLYFYDGHWHSQPMRALSALAPVIGTGRETKHDTSELMRVSPGT